MSARGSVKPNGDTRFGSAACLAAASSAFEGTQPEFRQSPPILPFSISTTGTPNAAAAAATERPPEPAPRTPMSGVRGWVRALRLLPLGRRRERGRARLLRAQPLHRDRNERDDAERRKS